MAVWKNGINLKEACELFDGAPADTRLSADPCINAQRFVEPFDYGFGNEFFRTDFIKFPDSSGRAFAAKGTRPQIIPDPNYPKQYTIDQIPFWFHQELDSTIPADAEQKLTLWQRYNVEVDKYISRYKEYTPGQYYLIKFSDKSVYWCKEDVPYTSAPPAGAKKIAGPEEDLQVVLMELQGAGGGGCGGGAWESGVGGASGGYAFIAVKLEHPADGPIKQNSLPMIVGQGGNYGDKGVVPTDGGYTGFDFDTDRVMHIPGGGCANQETNEIGGSGILTFNDQYLKSFINKIYADNGYSGTPGYGERTTLDYNITGFVPTGEPSAIIHPKNTTNGYYAGAGAGCAFGHGAEGRVGSGNPGWSGAHPGTGGGGGTRSNASHTRGGYGANGIVIIYY